MTGRGRWVLTFVFACALIGALAPAAGAHQGATQRSSDFDRGWKFALVNRTDITDPTGAYANAADPSYDDGPWRTRRPPARLEHRARPDARTARRATPATSRAAWAGTARPSRSRARRRTRGLARVRRRLHGLRRLPQRQAGRRPPVRLHRLRRRPHGTRTPTATPECRRRRGPQQAPEQPLVLGQRHLPQRASRRHRPGARRAPRDVRDHARRSRTRFKQGFATVHVADGRRRRHRRRTSVVTTVQDARGPTVAGGAPVDAAGRWRTTTCASSHPHLWSTDDPYLYTLDHRVRVRAATSSTARRTRFGVRWFQFDPDEGFSLNGTPRRSRASTCTTTRARSARRSTRTRSCARCDHEEHGRQRVPHVAQPAVAGDDRGLRGARHRDDGRGLRHLAHAQGASSTTGASSTPTATPTSTRWSTPRRTRRP